MLGTCSVTQAEGELRVRFDPLDADQVLISRELLLELIRQANPDKRIALV